MRLNKPLFSDGKVGRSIRFGKGIGYGLALLFCLVLSACGSGATDDTNGPRVVETNPAPEATGVPLSGPIEATLSKGIDPATINTDTFILTGISGEVTYQNGKAVFTPSIPLADGTTYHAVLTTGIRDLDGVPLPENFIWSFTTGATGGGGLDQTPPEIVSATPREGATNIPIDAPVRVVFSEPIRPETLRTDTFFIRGIPGEIRYDEATRTATLQPLAPLALQSRYEVTVTNQITDRTGNPLPATQSWSFTTASVIDLSSPVILSTVPGDGETGVAVNSAIQAVFNKEIDEQSLPSNFVLQGPGGGEIVSSIRYDSGARTATLTPSEALQPETTYQAIVRRGVSDFSGNALAADVRWSFTTVRSDDQTPPGDDRPEVIERQPIGIDIPLENFVTVRFSKAIRPETLAGNFMITTRGRAISAEIGYNISSNTATMIPSRLRHGTTYTVVLTHDIRDLAGNRLEHTSWSFRTVNRPDDDDDD
ncbi:MAG: Ig-like domain-containing protein [Candidatus Manganitrophus sp. SA1]|nr:Ig-like domain-containing protein [Candidatus Manganitrophus morganii]